LLSQQQWLKKINGLFQKCFTKLERMLFLFETGTKTGISNLRNAKPKRTRDMAKENKEKGITCNLISQGS
jgi:hypothetical protein